MLVLKLHERQQMQMESLAKSETPAVQTRESPAWPPNLSPSACKNCHGFMASYPNP